MKKVITEEKMEFLYPGDVWSGILGKDYKDKIEDFLRKGVSEAQYKDMKLIYNDVYTFLEWKPKDSLIAYEAILEDVVHNKERHLSFVCGFPFMEGKKQKMEITCIRGHEDHNRLEGYVGLSYVSDAQDMMAYNPCFALQRSVFYHLQPNKKGKYKANVCVAGLALSIKKSPRKIIKVNKGGFYEVTLKEFLEKNPDKTQADFPYAKVDASHVSAFFGKEIKDEYEYVSDIYSVKKFRFNDTDFYRLEIEVLRNIETDKGMKVYLYVNKELLGKYEPKVKDNIHGLMQLTAYLDEKECEKIMEASKEDVEIITSTGRVKYKVEIPASEDEFSNGLAFRDSLAPQTGMLYKYNSTRVGMFTPQTKVPVDYIFTDLCGNIMKIARDVKPLSRELHECCDTSGVLEINKGEADKLGIKEGDILVHRFLCPPKDYGKLTIKDADSYYRYDKDLYAEKAGELYFYSYKSHAWYNSKTANPEDTVSNRIENCKKMGIEKIVLSEKETETLMNEFENELRTDYAKNLKRYYRLHEKLFYSHDEINNEYQLYSFKKGWLDVNWLHKHQLSSIFDRDLALKITSKDIEDLVKKYEKEVKQNKYEDDIDNLAALKYYDDDDPNSEYYLVLGGTLWYINEKFKNYQTFDVVQNDWTDMDWLGDKLEHEVECARHLGQKLTCSEAVQKSHELERDYLKRVKNRKD